MIKAIVCCLAILSVPVIGFSQKTFVSFGAELALPVVHKNKPYGFAANAGTGFGGSVRVEEAWGKHISGIASVSYLSFAESHPYSSAPTTTTKVKAIPIQAGAKYYFREKKERAKGFFISTELGVMITTTHIDYEANPDFDFKESPICFAPGLGYLLGNFESSFRLQYNLGAAGFNVYYYNFRLAFAFQKRKAKDVNNK